MTPPYTPAGETRERVYRFVRRRLEHGQPPTLREVQAEFGFGAVETARKHLEKLVEEGRLQKSGRRARGYRLPVTKTPVTQVPLLGRVPAGGLSEAVEDAGDTVPVDTVPAEGGVEGGLFALRVEGESMRDVGILPGDLVIVQVQATARSGDIVVAMVDDEATVKTLRRVGRRVELHPENPAYQPIRPPADRLRILGKVVEVRRDLRRHLPRGGNSRGSR